MVRVYGPFTLLCQFLERARGSLDLSIAARTVSSVLHCLGATRPFHLVFRLARELEEEFLSFVDCVDFWTRPQRRALCLLYCTASERRERPFHRAFRLARELGKRILGWRSRLRWLLGLPQRRALFSPLYCIALERRDLSSCVSPCAGA